MLSWLRTGFSRCRRGNLGRLAEERKPVEFLRRMMALSRGKVIGSFPGKNPLRMRLRKFRYALRHCPVFFYSERDMHQLAQSAGLTRYKLVFIPYSGTGYVLVGEAGDQA
jgi:hypothetical protein